MAVSLAFEKIMDYPISDQPLWIVCGTDENYAMPLAVTIYSALSKSKNSSINLFIVEDDISATSKLRVERAVRRAHPETCLHWAKVPPQKLEGLKGNGRFSMAAYLRLFIPELLPPEAHKALYLDCDLLVLDDLRRLNEIDLKGRALGAVRDFSIATLSHPYSGIKHHDKLGLDPEAPYFNSGILVFDLDQWRAENISQKIIEYILECGGTLGNPDQDALNAMLPHDWSHLDYSWNVQGALLYLHEHASTVISKELKTQRKTLLDNAKIIHFSGSVKPWHGASYHPYTNQWRRCLLRSGWFTPLEFTLWLMNLSRERVTYRLRMAVNRLPMREKAD